MTAIRPCPEIQTGEGYVVTGRFVTPVVTQTVKLTLSDEVGRQEVIEGTAMHPIWSEDRGKWVAMGELTPGEHLAGMAGMIQVVVVEHLHDPKPVYNIEVQGQHAYEVGCLGLLVHNTDVPCPKAVVNALSDFQSRKFFINGENVLLDKAGMKHILERHHPSYWNGTTKLTQSFFQKKMTPADIESAIAEVLKQNRNRIAEIGANGICQMTGTVNGVRYQLGLNRGRVGQFFPLE